MSNPDYTRRNRRAPTDLEPKIVAGGTAGAATIVAVFVAGLIDVELPPEIASAITVLISAAAGYLKPS